MAFDLKANSRLIAMVCAGLAALGGCGQVKQPAVKKVPKKTVAVAPPPASKPVPRTPPKSFMPPSTPATPPIPDSDKPAPPRPAGSLSDLVQQGQAAEFALPQLEEGKITTAGIRKITGKHLTLYTDLPSTVEDVDKLPQVFDAAVPQWAKYFGVDETKLVEWKLIGCVMESKPRFQGAGLYPGDLPDFPNGFQRGSQFWLFEQPSDYYRRHLLLHEATHAFMTRWLNGAGPPWYMEGMAELLGTHDWNGQRLVLGYNPPDKALVPYWGRVKIVKDEFAANRGLTLFDIFRYDAQAHLKNDAYGWCWAVTTFLSNHPATRDEFQKLSRNTQDRSIEFSKKFYESLKPQWPQIAEDWQLFVINIDYGYDVARAATVRKASVPLPADGATIDVTADRFWQSTGMKVEAGKTYELTASGRYSLAQQPSPWWSEPGGVTIEYYQGKPLGMLLAAVSEPDAKDTGITPLATPEIIGLANKFTPRKNGTLYLCLNDSPARLGDNQGSAKVTIKPQAGGN